MTDDVMNEILAIAKEAGMKTSTVTVEMIKPLLDMDIGDICKKCSKWFKYDYIQNPGKLPTILNANEEYCSEVCKENK